MENTERQTLEEMGYDSFFESGRNRLGLEEFEIGRVISESKGAYKVKNAEGEYVSKVTGKLMYEASSREDYPAVGDWVAIEKPDQEHAVIRGILPRKAIIKRRFGDRNRVGEKSDIQIIAANIDIAFVVESVDRDYNLNRFERYFAIVENGGAKPAIILNKVDLLSREELDEKLAELGNRFPGITIVPTSTSSGVGLDLLRKEIERGKTYCLLGSSGVGKSSIINKLLGEQAAKTGDISSYSDRGKHVTTARQMYFLESGGIVIDNPGIREVGLADAGAGVESVFDDMGAFAEHCKFIDCTHVHEPGCRVIEAVRSGELDEEQYSNYISLKKEVEHYEMDDFEKRDRDRQFGKMLKNFKKESKKYKF